MTKNQTRTSPLNEKDIQFEKDYGFSRDKIRALFREQNKEQNFCWNFCDERVRAEDMFVQRFNFFIAYFAAVPLIAFTVSDNTLLVGIIFFIGTMVAVPLWCLVYRAYVKTDFILQMLYQLDEFYPFPVINKALANRTKGMCRFKKCLTIGREVNSLQGIYLPFMCCLLLFIGAMYSFYLHDDNRPNITNPNTQAPPTQTIVPVDHSKSTSNSEKTHTAP